MIEPLVSNVASDVQLSELRWLSEDAHPGPCPAGRPLRYALQSLLN
jgi:hypothetical protein